MNTATTTQQAQVCQLRTSKPYNAGVAVLETLIATTLHHVSKVNGTYFDLYTDAYGTVLACNEERETLVYFAGDSLAGGDVEAEMIREVETEIHQGLNFAHSDDDGKTCNPFRVQMCILSKEQDACPYVVYTDDGREIDRCKSAKDAASTIVDYIFEQ